MHWFFFSFMIDPLLSNWEDAGLPNALSAARACSFFLPV